MTFKPLQWNRSNIFLVYVDNFIRSKWIMPNNYYDIRLVGKRRMREEHEWNRLNESVFRRTFRRPAVTLVVISEVFLAIWIILCTKMIHINFCPVYIERSSASFFRHRIEKALLSNRSSAFVFGDFWTSFQDFLFKSLSLAKNYVTSSRLFWSRIFSFFHTVILSFLRYECISVSQLLWQRQCAEALCFFSSSHRAMRLYRKSIDFQLPWSCSWNKFALITWNWKFCWSK